MIPALLCLLVSTSAASTPAPPPDVESIEPVVHTYKHTPQGTLELHVFHPPANGAEERRPAVLVIHGGGWHTGEAAWTFGSSQRYARLGLVAASVEYRLSDEKHVTPIDAVADVRDAMRWLRSHADELGVDPKRIAAAGVSAGAHLAAVAALAPDDSLPSAAPDALILSSFPANVASDTWFRRIVGAHDPAAYSPLQLVHAGAPPAIVVMGEKDTVTPSAHAERFCAAMTEHGARCELLTYASLGHLLTRNLEPRAQEEGPFDTDPEAAKDARARVDRFLASLGYLPH